MIVDQAIATQPSFEQERKQSAMISHENRMQVLAETLISQIATLISRDEIDKAKELLKLYDKITAPK